MKPARRHLLRLLLPVLLPAALLWALPSPATALALFGTREEASVNLTPFPKWRGMLARAWNEEPLLHQPCGVAGACPMQSWQHFLDQAGPLSFAEKIRQVNDYMNRIVYILDPINWGVPDYWASPYQFFVRDGDCEDYAIAKFLSLRALGVPNDAMRIIILQDLNLGLVHSVLGVNDGQTVWILDNQIKQVIPHTAIRHYVPIYSINETHWWRHAR